MRGEYHLPVSTGQRIILESTGKIRIESFELPRPGPHDILVRTRLTQVSAGTEVNAIRARRSGALLGEVADLPLGYTSVGTVEAVGSTVAGFAPGDRVLGNGPHASHWFVTQAAGAGTDDAWTFVDGLLIVLTYV